MEPLVSMMVYPEHILHGDLIRINGRVARVLLIVECWDDRYKFVVTCQDSNFNYIYGCMAHEPVTLLSIQG